MRLFFKSYVLFPIFLIFRFLGVLPNCDLHFYTTSQHNTLHTVAQFAMQSEQSEEHHHPAQLNYCTPRFHFFTNSLHDTLLRVFTVSEHKILYTVISTSPPPVNATLCTQNRAMHSVQHCQHTVYSALYTYCTVYTVCHC